MGDVSRLTPAGAEPVAGAAAGGRCGRAGGAEEVLRAAGARAAAGHRRRHRHPAPGAGQHLRRFAGALSLPGDPPARPLAGSVGAVPAGHRPRGAGLPEPPHPRGADVVDGGTGRHRAQRRRGGADRRHHRLHRRPPGPGDAAFRGRLDGVPGAAVAAHHHVDCRPRHGADHHSAGGSGRHPGLARGARSRAGGEGERLLPGGAGDRQLAPALAAAPRAAQHRRADHHHLQHQCGAG